MILGLKINDNETDGPAHVRNFCICREKIIITTYILTLMFTSTGTAKSPFVLGDSVAVPGTQEKNLHEKVNCNIIMCLTIHL